MQRADDVQGQARFKLLETVREWGLEYLSARDELRTTRDVHAHWYPKAWLDLAASEKAKVPTASANCANPVDKVLELGRSLRITGTPTLFFANGERAGGGMPIGQLRVKLDEAAKQQATKKN